MLWSEWLEQHKRSSGSDCVLKLSRMTILQDFAVGWRNSTIIYPADQEVPNADDLKSALWEICQFDWMEISHKSALTISECKLLYRNAVAMDLIYPDGTLNEAANKLLSGIIAKNIKGAVK